MDTKVETEFFLSMLIVDLLVFLLTKGKIKSITFFLFFNYQINLKEEN